VDIDAGVFNQVYPVDRAVQADAGRLLVALAGRVPDRKPWFGGRRRPLAPANDPAKGASAAETICAANARLPDDALVSADIGNHRLWVCDGLAITGPDRLLQSCEFDAMGFSLPAAIGASIAAPGRKVLSISGDGGFVHTLGELAVAREHGLPVIAMVFVDGALGILRHQAEEMYGQEHFTGLAPIDFAQVASGFGIPARDVADRAGIDDALDWAFAETGPALVVVRIDPDEVFPPLRSKIEQRKRDLMGKC
jgi:thiamine pyrophosphate-dependent acetolactate synthase large subunit-like protein